MKAQYVDHMGTDLSVVNAARVSFDKASEWVPSGAANDYAGVIYQTIDGKAVNLSKADASLIQFLARGCTSGDWKQHITDLLTACDWDFAEHLLLAIKRMPEHWTPFGHTAITLRMQAPVPIRTQCFKHKQGLVENEESRRYIASKPQVYIPDHFRSAPEGSIKQGSGETHPRSGYWRNCYRMRVAAAVEMYEQMILDGVCPEQARLVLPQGCEVNWVWTGNLYAFANFYNKRTDSHAQQEIQQLAHEVGRLIRPLFPVSWDALTGDAN